jgi:shikimate kinase
VNPGPHILLLGLRGAGKSTLGPGLARALGLGFLDLDALTSAVLGMSPAEALRTLGEPAFRDGEHQALAQALVSPASVIALGGGTPTHPPCEALIRTLRQPADGAAASVRTLYLHAPPAELRARLAQTDLAKRPGLTGADPLAEIDALYARRDGLYRDLADAVVEVAGDSGPAAQRLLAAARDTLSA